MAAGPDLEELSMPSEPVKRPGQNRRNVQVVTFEEAVRGRAHWYFGTDGRGSALAAAVVRQAAADALNAPRGTPAVAELLVHSDLRFTISDNGPVPYSDVVQPAVPYWHGSNELIHSAYRAGLAAAAALSSLAVIQVSAEGRSWRQEFIRGEARSVPADEGPADGPGTRAAFELDVEYFEAGTAIPRDTVELRPVENPWPRGRGKSLTGTLTITDLRTQPQATPSDSS
jgi:DNA gyrase/topoisomerase IV subunit B